MTRESGFKRRVRARMARTGESYATAHSMLDRHRQPAVLHVTDGDSAAGTLRQATGEPVIAWRDVLHEGPVPALPPGRLASTRAAFLATAFGGSGADIRGELEARDRALAAGAGRPVVLWFDADLYDQLQLLQVLDRLATLAPARITLVSVAEYAGRAHFGGLGELSAPQLVDLHRSSAQEVGDADLELARAAWSAFTAADHEPLAALRHTRTPALRHLGEAITRLLEEYPWTGDGLSLTERRVLRAVASGGAKRTEVFRAVWGAEPRPFAGDSVVFAILDRLRSIGLVQDRDGLRVSPRGKAVLAGEVDAAERELNRWIGGVHLTSPPAWRWDPRLERLVGG